jgi:transcriptional regulator with XRE-family HTH domain
VAKQYHAGSLTGADFKHIRQGLLLTQRELADLLGYAQKIRISEYERATNPVAIPLHIQEALLRLRESGGLHSTARDSVREWVRRDAAAA